MFLKILDLNTGRRRSHKSPFGPQYWLDGNGSCDCNRALVFEPDFNLGQKTCAGCHRYLIVETDAPDITPWEFNQFYPEALRRQAGISEPEPEKLKAEG